MRCFPRLSCELDSAYELSSEAQRADHLRDVSSFLRHAPPPRVFPLLRHAEHTLITLIGWMAASSRPGDSAFRRPRLSKREPESAGQFDLPSRVEKINGREESKSDTSPTLRLSSGRDSVVGLLYSTQRNL
uniref:Uncharacterized protein n=1 Tax=Sphaerodactylus townsendi TaxID=933632 RepID=A0ACB8ER09_9SAUR